jgi:hypothetical protein
MPSSLSRCKSPTFKILRNKLKNIKPHMCFADLLRLTPSKFLISSPYKSSSSGCFAMASKKNARLGLKNVFVKIIDLHPIYVALLSFLLIIFP